MPGQNNGPGANLRGGLVAGETRVPHPVGRVGHHRQPCYDRPMPRPFGERESLEQERAELQECIAAWNIEVGAAAETDSRRREFRDRQIRNARRRLIAIADRLEELDNPAVN